MYQTGKGCRRDDRKALELLKQVQAAAACSDCLPRSLLLTIDESGGSLPLLLLGRVLVRCLPAFLCMCVPVCVYAQAAAAGHDMAESALCVHYYRMRLYHKVREGHCVMNPKGRHRKYGWVNKRWEGGRPIS